MADNYGTPLPQSPKPAGTIHLLDCHRVFDPKTRGLHVNYCLGMDVGENTYYVKADTASLYNVWLDVRKFIHVHVRMYIHCICIAYIVIYMYVYMYIHVHV